MKFVRFALITLVSLSFVNQAIAATTPKPPANTFAVTPAGAALGFTMTEIITGMPTTVQGWGVQGATGIVAAKNGDIIVVNGNDNVVRVYSNSDTKNGSKLKFTSTIAGVSGGQLTSLSGNVYVNLESVNSIVQLNDNGTLAKTIVSNMASTPHNLIASPANNSLLFFSWLPTASINIITAPNGGPVYNNLNPAPSYYKLNWNTSAGYWNMYFDCCSNSMYSENLSFLERNALSGMNLNLNLHTYIEGGPWDGAGCGIAKIGGNSPLNGLFVLNNRTDAILINPDSNVRTTIISGGTQVGSRTAAHQDGSLLVIQGGSVFKLRCGAGCSFL